MPLTVKADYIICRNNITVPNIIENVTTTVTNVSAATYTVLSTNAVLRCDTSSNAITITLLPASTSGYVGRTITILDANATFSTNNVTVESSNGTDTIQGSTEDLIIDIDRASVDLLCTSATSYNIV